MPDSRGVLTTCLTEQLSMLVTTISAAGQNNLTGTHVVAETTVAGLLNRVYGWDLKNANTRRQNCPGVDLVDEGSSVAVQVTATRTAEKVRHTLEAVANSGLQFERLILLFLTHEAPTRAMTACAGRAELLCISDVLRAAMALDMEPLEELTVYMARELGIIRAQAEARPWLELPPVSALQGSGFVGRGPELAEIGRRFAEGDRLVVLSGLGGMGKTELAMRYARSHPGLTHFARFDTDFVHTLANMALGIRPRLPDEALGQDERILADMVLALLEQSDENDLLILDNADGGTGVLADLLADPLFGRLSGMPLRILLTTRSDWDDAVRVGPMPEEPLFAIFRRHGAVLEDEEKRALIREVNGHTMTIDLIARILNGKGRRKVTALMLLEDLRKHALPEKKYRDIAAHYRQSPGQAQIYQHLSVVFDVSDMSDTDRAVMGYATLLPEGGMECAQFDASIREAELASLDRLLESGWLEARNGLLTIHPVIRLVCLTELKPTDECCEDFLNTLIGQYDETDYQPAKYRKMAELLTNASDTLEDTEGVCAMNAGVLWSNLGAFAKALDCTLYAVSQMEAHLPPEHRLLADAYNNLGVTYGNLGDHRKALNFKMKALTIREKVLPPEHPDLAQFYSNVGSTYGALGNHRKALEFKQKALTIREKVLPPEHLELAHSYNSVGATYDDLGDHRKALNFKMKALTIREKVLPPEHPDLAHSYNNVGATYGDLGDHRKELDFTLKALTIREKVLPPEHPDLAWSYSNVCVAYGNLGDHRKALDFMLKALTIFEKVLPPEHPDLALAYSNIAWMYHELGDLPDAARFMRQAADVISRSSLPGDHPYRVKITRWADRFEEEANASKPKKRSWLARLFGKN